MIAASGALRAVKGGEEDATWRWNGSSRNGSNDRTCSRLLRGK